MDPIEVEEDRLKRIWNQADIPVILRRGRVRERLRLRLPISDGNREWLRAGYSLSPKWAPEWLELRRCWETPKSWFNDLVERTLERYGKVYIIQPYREQEKCAPACMNASGHECQCSCMGANHGAGSDGSWFEVSETFATRWGERQLACRLMKKRCFASS